MGLLSRAQRSPKSSATLELDRGLIDAIIQHSKNQGVSAETLIRGWLLQHEARLVRRKRNPHED